MSEDKKKGFAAMTPERRKEIGRLGGKAAHANGVGHKFTSETGRAAGKKAHEDGKARTWTSEEAREAGRRGGSAPRRERKAEGASDVEGE